MSDVALTKQGVRDLGGNCQTAPRRCLHVRGQRGVVGHITRSVWGAWGEVIERTARYGYRCVHCQKVMP